MGHTHSVVDSNIHFLIDPVTRKLKNESAYKMSVVQFDNNSERLTFEMPRFVEGHDMTTCNVVQVHYINIDAKTKEEEFGVYDVDDLQISQDDEGTVVFSWLISHNATKLVGALNFLVRFSCVTDSVVDYAWNTNIFSSITVASGIYNGENVAAEFADVLAQWKAQFDAVRIVEITQTQIGTNDGEPNVWTVRYADGRTTEFQVLNGSKGDSMELTSDAITTALGYKPMTPDDAVLIYNGSVHLPRTEDDKVVHGTVGQFAVSDGKGGITWLTIRDGNEVAY